QPELVPQVSSIDSVQTPQVSNLDVDSTPDQILEVVTPATVEEYQRSEAQVEQPRYETIEVSEPHATSTVAEIAELEPKLEPEAQVKTQYGETDTVHPAAPIEPEVESMPMQPPDSVTIEKEAELAQPEETSIAVQHQQVAAADQTPGPEVEIDQSTYQLAVQILTQAVSINCTDVHFEPVDEGVALRFLSGGDLQGETVLPIELKEMIVVCLKAMAQLNPNVSDRPQDKKFTTDLFGPVVNMRVTTIPGMFGEMVSVSITQA
ncbi:MAG: hypothetical protein K2Z81_02060, partial [Cyanobacteria bacterium]|nr:hypothetical protein [Cyanobacteriota bacterium]